MSRKKGLSFEEKRLRMQEVFFSSKDVYTLKQLEKICPKKKGITQQTVKEVLQSLCDDALVDSDKIGISNFFWMFPSKALQRLKEKEEMFETQKAKLVASVDGLVAALEKAQEGREDSAERRASLEELATVEAEHTALTKELNANRELDPEVVAEVQAQVAEAKEAANRWSDNLSTLRRYCHTKFNMERKAFNKGVGVTEADEEYL